jgi:hypothetical protein
MHPANTVEAITSNENAFMLYSFCT